MHFLFEFFRLMLSFFLKSENVTLFVKFKPDEKWFTKNKSLIKFFEKKDIGELHSVTIPKIIFVSLWKIKAAKAFWICISLIIAGLFFRESLEDFLLAFYLSFFIVIFFASLEIVNIAGDLIYELKAEKLYMNYFLEAVSRANSYLELIVFINHYNDSPYISKTLIKLVTGVVWLIPLIGIYWLSLFFGLRINFF